MEFANLSDKELNLLLEKYKEKQLRYNLMLNEVTLRNERILLKIHLEQVWLGTVESRAVSHKME